MNKIAVLEGLLFIVGDDGITLDKICDVLEINENEAKKVNGTLLKEIGIEEISYQVKFDLIIELENDIKLKTKIKK